MNNITAWDLNKKYKTGEWISLGVSYYMSLRDDNTVTPSDGVLAKPRTWSGPFDENELVHVIKVEGVCKSESCEDTCGIVLSLEDVPELCEGEDIQSGDVRKYNSGIYVACKDMLCISSFPDLRDWRGPFGITDILKRSMSLCSAESLPLELPVWENCSDGDNCVTTYPLNSCLWSYDHDSKSYKIYTSLKDDNHDKPYDGSKATPKTWDGGFTVSELINILISI